MTSNPEDELDPAGRAPAEAPFLAAWRLELETALAHAARLVDADEAADPLATRWVLTEDAIVWWVETGEVAESDVDLEDLGEVIVVRVRRTSRPDLARALLPMPVSVPLKGVAVAFHGGALEVRLLLRVGD